MQASCCSTEISRWLSPELFKALGEPNRLAILAHLAQATDQLAVGEVATCCDVDLSVVSRHLRVLREAGVVEAVRDGKRVLYRVKVRELARSLRGLADALERCCPGEECTFEGESRD